MERRCKLLTFEEGLDARLEVERVVGGGLHDHAQAADTVDVEAEAERHDVAELLLGAQLLVCGVGEEAGEQLDDVGGGAVVELALQSQLHRGVDLAGEWAMSVGQCQRHAAAKAA